MKEAEHLDRASRFLYHCENFGFGSWSDYIKCFFWGLGFSVAGTQLDQLTQTAVTGNFGITIPKA